MVLQRLLCTIQLCELKQPWTLKSGKKSSRVIRLSRVLCMVITTLCPASGPKQCEVFRNSPSE